MSGLSVPLSFMSLRLIVKDVIQVKDVANKRFLHSDKCLEIEFFLWSECSENRVAKFLSVGTVSTRTNKSVNNIATQRIGNFVFLGKKYDIFLVSQITITNLTCCMRFRSSATFC